MPVCLPVHVGQADAQSLEAHRSTVVNMVLVGWNAWQRASRGSVCMPGCGGATRKPCSRAALEIVLVSSVHYM